VKHKWFVAFLVVVAMALFVNLNLASAADSASAAAVVVNPPLVEKVEPTGEAMDPPAGAFFDILPHGRSATVIVRGFGEIYHNWLYVYGAGRIEAYPIVAGKAEIPARRWMNLAFRDKASGLWRYILVDDDYRFVRPDWMGSGVGIKPNTGKGSALTAKEWLDPEYR
jgi:hypothetical protein